MITLILGGKIPFVPYLVEKWHREHPGQTPEDGLILVQRGPGGDPEGKLLQQTVVYQYRQKRARKTLRNIDKQAEVASRVLAGKTKAKTNKYVKVLGGSKKLNAVLLDKHRMLAGWKAYETNIPSPSPEFVIGSYHQLWRIEKSFRMSKGDLQARPIYHRLRDSIEAHLTIVFAALAISHWIETATGWSIKKFIKEAREVRTTYVQVGDHQFPVDDPISDDLAEAFTAIKTKSSAHPDE